MEVATHQRGRVKKVLYVAPRPGEEGGIADYAIQFRKVISEVCDFDNQFFPVSMPSKQEVRDIWRNVRHETRTGRYKQYSLVHLELAHATYREYFYAQALRRYAQVPLVVTLHEPREIVHRPYRYLNLETKPRPIRIARRILDEHYGRAQRRRLLRAATPIVLGLRGRRDLEEVWGISGSQVVPHVAFPSGKRRERDDAFHILFAGFIGPHKGLETLLEAFRLLRMQQPGQALKLHIVGKDPQYGQKPLLAQLDQLGIATDVELPGYLSEEELLRTFCESSVAVLPYEPQLGGAASGMLIRALSSGTPTICSNVPSLRQDIVVGKTALEFPAGNAQALADELSHLMRDKRLRASLGQAARATMEQTRSAAALASKLRHIYENA